MNTFAITSPRNLTGTDIIRNHVFQSSSDAFFVRGLDAGDREIGIFSAFGLLLIQPFAKLADLYLRVPPTIIDKENGKWLLNSSLLTQDVSAVVGRAKCRAQVGGADGGTLGIYHNLGITQENLLAMWASQTGLGHASLKAEALIQFGRYRQAPNLNS